MQTSTILSYSLPAFPYYWTCLTNPATNTTQPTADRAMNGRATYIVCGMLTSVSSCDYNRLTLRDIPNSGLKGLICIQKLTVMMYRHTGTLDIPYLCYTPCWCNGVPEPHCLYHCLCVCMYDMKLHNSACHVHYWTGAWESTLSSARFNFGCTWSLTGATKHTSYTEGFTVDTCAVVGNELQDTPLFKSLIAWRIWMRLLPWSTLSP